MISHTHTSNPKNPKQKKIYFTVGPTQLYPSLPQHIVDAMDSDILSESHTGDFFTSTYRKLCSNLKELFEIPSSHHIFFTGSSTESMHSIIASTVKEKSLHLIIGGFSEKFYKAAVDLGKQPNRLEIGLDEEVGLGQLRIPKGTELLCITENDTSTGIQLPLSGLKALKSKNPLMLIAVDIVSSAPSAKVDYSAVDIAFFSVHKGLGLPAGLGILIANDKAINKAKQLAQNKVVIGGHHSLATLAEKESIFLTPETPNVLNIYLLEKITADLLAVGIDAVRTETNLKAERIYSYFDKHPRYKPLVSSLHRSQTTPVIRATGNATKVADALAIQGFIVSKGYRPYQEDHIRIANFPAHTIQDVDRLLDAFDEL